MSLPAQTRAYAEYRMFSAASGLDLREVHMDVLLDERKSPWTGAQYRCSVVLTLAPAGRIRVRATGDRVYMAIDRAAKSLSRSLEPHVAGGSLAATPGAWDRLPLNRGAERESGS
jgi:ribosome-associated translation inhibitor RaiA